MPRQRSDWDALAAAEAAEASQAHFFAQKVLLVLGFGPLLIVTVATGAHLQHVCRELWGMPPAAVAAAWTAFAATSGLVEAGLALGSGGRPSRWVFAAAVAWLATVGSIWSPKSHDWVSSGWFAPLMAAHGLLHAYLQVNWSSLFPQVFLGQRERAFASWNKQIVVTGALIVSMTVVPALAGPTWQAFGRSASVVVGAGIAYVVILGMFWGIRGTVSPIPVSSQQSPRVGPTQSPSWSAKPIDAAGLFGSAAEPAPSCKTSLSTRVGHSWAAAVEAAVMETVSRIARSPSLRSFLVSDALAVVGNSCITALFPLFCRMVIGTSEASITLHLAQGLPEGMMPHWLLQYAQVTIEPAAHIPVLYAVFYITGALCGPAWAWAAARVDIASIWQVETVIYTAALGCLLLVKTYWHAIICTAAMGVSVSGFSMLPELLLARLVDEASALHPSGASSHAQAIVAAKSVGRRLASALQGALVSWALLDIGYTPGEPRGKQQPGVAGWLRFLTVAIPTFFFALSAASLSWYSLGAPVQASWAVDKARAGAGELREEQPPAPLLASQHATATTCPSTSLEPEAGIMQSLPRRRGATSAPA